MISIPNPGSARGPGGREVAPGRRVEKRSSEDTAGLRRGPDGPASKETHTHRTRPRRAVSRGCPTFGLRRVGRRLRMGAARGAREGSGACFPLSPSSRSPPQAAGLSGHEILPKIRLQRVGGLERPMAGVACGGWARCGGCGPARARPALSENSALLLGLLLSISLVLSPLRGRRRRRPTAAAPAQNPAHNHPQALSLTHPHPLRASNLESEARKAAAAGAKGGRRRANGVLGPRNHRQGVVM